MTAKQILDAFSETLMQDERILSPRERELLMSILQNSRAVPGSYPETQSAVTAAIARSVGETVAQRAFALLGGSIVEQILAGAGIPAATEETTLADRIQFSPAPGPQPPNAPGTSWGKASCKGAAARAATPERASTAGSPASTRQGFAALAPEPPNAPLPPGHGLRPFTVQQGVSRFDSGKPVGVLDAPAIVRAQCVVLDEFLAPQELDELVSYALEHEAEFQTSELISPNGDPGVTDYSHRRSRVLMDLGKHQEVILERIRGVLPRVLDQFGIEEFPVTHVEAQITASNDGDFFRAHSDDAQETIASRRITFVYFFQREPRQFAGGDLRLHDVREGAPYVSAGSYQTVVPQQNQIVFFPCSVLHEITPVECPSRAFADSRFTLNGWLHQ